MQALFLGYSGNGTFCTDIDECQPHGDEPKPRHNCDSNSQCTDTEGSFTCECLDGFEGDGVTCRGTHLV